MKLWLLELLACPIDKKYPLELTILSWHEPKKALAQLKKLIEGYPQGNVLFKEMSSPVHFEHDETSGKWLIHDDLIIKPTPLTEYLNELQSKISELAVVHDVSCAEGENILNMIRTEVNEHLSAAMKDLDSGNSPKEIISAILPDLELLNLFKYHMEIEDAVIICPQCHRWYPVFEAIPQLLPDAVRNSNEDKQFQEKWQNSVKFPTPPTIK
ncbi:MAG: Trm112 family protein [Promethearchaeota archaeon]